MMSIILALGVGSGNATQTIIAKFMVRKFKTNVISMTSDVGLIFVLITFIISFIQEKVNLE